MDSTERFEKMANSIMDTVSREMDLATASLPPEGKVKLNVIKKKMLKKVDKKLNDEITLDELFSEVQNILKDANKNT